MDQSPWQHGVIERVPVPPADPVIQAFGSGIAFGVVLVVGLLLLHRLGQRRRSGSGRYAALTGWGDLFRLLGFVVRGVVLLAFGLLLLGRVLLWPVGRRW